MSKEPQKLKPIVFSASRTQKHSPALGKQMLLLKAMEKTTDPKQLKEMIKVKTVAEVYRTLDKMAMRKEYHEALARAGVSFDYLVTNLKDIADHAKKDKDRLGATQALLKSVGMDKYDVAEAPSGTWEDALLNSMQNEETYKEIEELPTYEVQHPQLPDSVRKIREEESKLSKGLYD